MQSPYVTLFFFFFFFFVGMGFEIKICRWCTALVKSPFSSGYFGDEVSRTI
jgi:hypothetical protein